MMLFWYPKSFTIPKAVSPPNHISYSTANSTKRLTACTTSTVYNPLSFCVPHPSLNSQPGPIVRINPNELHVKDPDWYDELYTSSSRPREKSSWYLGRISGGSIHGTVPHDHHRLRRSAFNHMFSKRAIEAVGPVLQDKVDVLCKAVEGYLVSGEVMSLDLAYIALTIDMISEYAFGESFKLLEKPGFSQEWKDAILGQFESAIPLRHTPWLMSILMLLPDSVASKINKPTAAFLENRAVGPARLDSWMLGLC